MKTTLCPRCSGRGWVVYTEDGNDYAKPCDCGLNERERENRRLTFANIPSAYRESTLKDVKVGMYTKTESKNAIKSILTAIKYWLDHLPEMTEQGRGLYFWSETKGCGKTLTAAAISNELMSRGERVKFTTSIQIIQEIKSTWDSDADISESRLLYDLSTVSYLVIDDFGTEKVKDWIAERFYNIINNRYTEKKVTIFTSNSVINELDYDERITNRITERCFKLHFPEESIRTYIGQMNTHELNEGIKEIVNGGII